MECGDKRSGSKVEDKLLYRLKGQQEWLMFPLPSRCVIENRQARGSKQTQSVVKELVTLICESISKSTEQTDRTFGKLQTLTSEKYLKPREAVRNQQLTDLWELIQRALNQSSYCRDYLNLESLVYF